MNNTYISQLNLQEFALILNEFDIELASDVQNQILKAIQNNQYALKQERYLFVIENYIKKLTSDKTCQKLMYMLNSYFKPLLNI